MDDNLPQVKDFSRESIERAVREAATNSFVTFLPPVLGVLSGAVAFLFGISALYYAMAGGLAIGGGNVVLQTYFRRDAIAARHLRKVSEFQKQKERMLQEALETELEECVRLPGAEEVSERGIDQFQRLKKKFENVQELLTEQLGASGGLMLNRTAGAAGQVYLSTLDNLKRVTAFLKSASSIEVKTIKKRLKELECKRSESCDRERKALQEQLDLYEDQHRKAEALLALNEESMAGMERTSAAIAEMTGTSSFSRMDLETAIQSLQDIAKSIKTYNQSQNGKGGLA